MTVEDSIIIQQSELVVLDISGKDVDRSLLTAKVAKARDVAANYAGRVMLEVPFDDGYGLIISFTDSMKARAFKAVFGV